MKIQTFSIVVGTRACNAKCPFCISHMTGFEELPKKKEINYRNLKKAISVAQIGGTSTVLLTGKGEPTLYPLEVSDYLDVLEDKFPFVEIQTNALEIGRLVRDGKSKIKHLDFPRIRNWYNRGLSTIAISVVDVNVEENRKVYHEDYPPLENTVAFLKEEGFTVRLGVMLKKGAVDSPERLKEVIHWCRDNKVDQLTVRPLRRPERSESKSGFDWVGEHGLEDSEVQKMRTWVQKKGTQLLNLMHGGEVYDVFGQNICLTDCLTLNTEEDKDDIRTLIFFPSGRLSYSWEHKGATLLGGWGAK